MCCRSTNVRVNGRLAIQETRDFIFVGAGLPRPYLIAPSMDALPISRQRLGAIVRDVPSIPAHRAYRDYLPRVPTVAPASDAGALFFRG